MKIADENTSMLKVKVKEIRRTTKNTFPLASVDNPGEQWKREMSDRIKINPAAH
jgi:hypothetical protein